MAKNRRNPVAHPVKRPPQGPKKSEKKNEGIPNSGDRRLLRREGNLKRDGISRYELSKKLEQVVRKHSKTHTQTWGRGEKKSKVGEGRSNASTTP